MGWFWGDGEVLWAGVQLWAWANAHAGAQQGCKPRWSTSFCNPATTIVPL
jgi:hypothetical protein